MRSVDYIGRCPPPHWVGNGFRVHSLFSHADRPYRTDPFLLLDYAAPQVFDADGTERGVGAHPHKGFETVTIAYQGEVAHRDSAGGGGVIGAGDVQWMTAGRGIVHQEFHGGRLREHGGTLEMVQLWVNLPARDKLTAPRYQHLAQADIPVLALPDNAGSVRVIAGDNGAAHTFTEMNVWDIALNGNGACELTVPAAHNLMVVSLHGETRVNGTERLTAGEWAHFARDGERIALQAGADGAKLLLLSGVPIDEPLAAYGPFVMNTQDEIRTAINDFRQGRFGTVAATTA